MKFFNKLFLTLLILSSFKSISQDLEPRFLSSLPIKSNIAGVIYSYSTGNILMDNSLPIEDLNSDMHSGTIVYVRSFSLFNKLAKFDFNLSYSNAQFNALVEDSAQETTRTGIGDPNFRVSIILIGDEPLEASKFGQRKISKFKLGVALKTRIPIGQYDNSKLINLGSNRFGFHFKTAAAYRISPKLIIEGHVSSWFFTTNNSFYADNKLWQEPLLSTQLNTAYIFNPKTWASVAIGAVFFGQTHLNELKQENHQNNSRYSFTFSRRIGKKGSLKFIATNGLSTNIGTDFTSYLLGYQFLWLDKTKKL
ncbi:MAG: hypothetical protein BM563_01990 [Bacteroidetes bacterium MedPE-SWsnd-G1]|nr:MAG: hypothetical protein BM563_01990 [Bacteroidetes bacterium MedPE-SWsnd-G1]